MSLALALYRAGAALLEPAAPAILCSRAARGKEDRARLGERLGRPSRPRPEGPLAWLHGASVGESLSLLPVIDHLSRRRPGLNLLVTSGTVTSAELMARRLPQHAIHQYSPIDGPGAAARFAEHWRPDLAVFVESELWPNLLFAARDRGARLALISARMSLKSFRGWERIGGAARPLFEAFDLVLPQDDAAALCLTALGARDDGRLNLKYAGDPLPVEPALLERLAAELSGRPMLLAASTHPGEDAMVLCAFGRVAEGPQAQMLVIVPRHPARGPEIAAEARARGFQTSLRSAGEALAGAQVHVADTLGELGAWFRLARGALIAGSLAPGIGGHNPLEPLRLGCPVATGLHVDSWQSVYDELIAEELVQAVGNAEELGDWMVLALSRTPPGWTDRTHAFLARRSREIAASLALLDRWAP